MLKQKSILGESLLELQAKTKQGFELKPNYTDDEKSKILEWLKIKPDCVAFKPLRDPATNDIYATEKYIYSKGGYRWNTESEYMISKYNAPICDEFYQSVLQ